MTSIKPFGLRIQSEIELPGCAYTDSNPDVIIGLGKVPKNLHNPKLTLACTQVSPNQFLLSLDNVARYLVENGNSITIEPVVGVGEEEIRLFLMSSVWSALLLQRGILPLHGSCISVKDRAIVIGGYSGNGKSTLAAALMQAGYPLIADELCGVIVSENSLPFILPGFPQVLLWTDSLQKLGIESHGLSRVRPNMEKYALNSGNSQMIERVPFEQLYILSVINTPTYQVVPLKGISKVSAIVDSTYRVQHVGGLGLNVLHFKQCTDIAKNIKVKNIERPTYPFDIPALVRLITEDFSC